MRTVLIACSGCIPNSTSNRAAHGAASTKPGVAVKHDPRALTQLVANPRAFEFPTPFEGEAGDLSVDDREVTPPKPKLVGYLRQLLYLEGVELMVLDQGD